MGVLIEQLRTELAAVIDLHLGPLARLGGEVLMTGLTRYAKPRSFGNPTH
jgi:hypothetical protein